MLELCSGNAALSLQHQRKGQITSPLTFFRPPLSARRLCQVFCHNVLLGAHVNLCAHSVPDNPLSLQKPACIFCS